MILKRTLLAALTAFVCSLGLHAVPAFPGALPCPQPDGTTVNAIAHGDEFYHWITTSDGYVVAHNAQQGLVYATSQQPDGTIVPGDILAHDPQGRSAEEASFVATQALKSSDLAAIGRATSNKARSLEASRAPQRRMAVSDKFRGLVILVEYKDMKFLFGDEANAQYTDMCGKLGYTGYTFNGQEQTYIGSVRDYFNDNSQGQFNPPFDVVGPVTIDYSCLDAAGTSNAQILICAAIKAADPYVDYSKYDSDGDGKVDMVFFLCAGYGSNYSGNNSGYIWPHKSIVYGMRREYPDNMEFDTYACSVERCGLEGSQLVDGIGTFCHEFSHVLGLWDEYDTDYDGSGGQSNHPGAWSVMAGGSYNNNGRSPVGYSLFQRQWMQFTTPVTIDSIGTYDLQPLYTSNAGYILPSPKDNEYFTLEYRLKDKRWERYLPGSGMLIYRVDFSDDYPWRANRVNADPSHMYLELLRANNTGGNASDRDPFPGRSQVTFINNYTTPSLRTWDGKFNTFGLQNITEGNGHLTFEVIDMPKMLVEDFANGAVSEDGYYMGKVTDWIFDGKATIETPDCGNGIDGEAVAMCKDGILQTVPLEQNLGVVTFNTYNPNSAAALLVQYSLDDGDTWQYLPDSEGKVQAITLPGSSSGYHMLDMSGIAQDAVKTIFRIKQYNGSKTKPLYIDNIAMGLTKKDPSGITDIQTTDTQAQEIGRYDLQGRAVDAHTPGLVIVRYSDGTARKAIIR